MSTEQELEEGAKRARAVLDRHRGHLDRLITYLECSDGDLHQTAVVADMDRVSEQVHQSEIEAGAAADRLLAHRATQA